VKSHRISSL